LPGPCTPWRAARPPQRSPRVPLGRDLEPPFSARCAPDLALHRELADLALRLPELAFGRIGRALLQPLGPRGDELVTPGGKPMRLDPGLPRHGVQILTAEQAHHRVGLASDRPPELLVGALPLGHHRHLGPPPAPSSRRLSRVQRNRERWTPRERRADCRPGGWP